MAKKMNINATINNVTENDIAALKALFGDRIVIQIIESDSKKGAPKRGGKTTGGKTKTTKTTTAKVEVAEEVITNDENIVTNDEEVGGNDRRKTYAEAIDDWKIAKYGDLDTAAAVQDMTKVVAADWKKQWKETGKPVVSKKNYKEKLYAEAYLRVLIANKAKKVIVNQQRAVVEGLK